MSQTSSKNARVNSHPYQIGEVPYWLDTYDEIVYYDTDTRTVRCRKCKGEVKNLGWVRTHMADCFDIR